MYFIFNHIQFTCRRAWFLKYLKPSPKSQWVEPKQNTAWRRTLIASVPGVAALDAFVCECVRVCVCTSLRWCLLCMLHAASSVCVQRLLVVVPTTDQRVGRLPALSFTRPFVWRCHFLNLLSCFLSLPPRPLSKLSTLCNGRASWDSVYGYATIHFWLPAVESPLNHTVPRLTDWSSRCNTLKWSRKCNPTSIKQN